MIGAHYFQIEGFHYEHNPLVLGRLGVGFQFFVTPDGDGAKTHKVQVTFSLQLLTALGKHFVTGGPFLTAADKPKFLRYAFHLLKTQLEQSNLSNWDDIQIDSQHADQLGQKLPKACEFLELKENEWHCSMGDRASDVPFVTSLDLCEECSFPEPICRCDNLRLKTNSGWIDSEQGLRRQAKCYCIVGQSLPEDVYQCRGMQCFVPFKFYFPLPKRHIGYKTPR